jgi:hypothetical protein
VTALEADLRDAWDELADVEQEHDESHAARAWERIRQLQQREAPHAEAVRLAPQAPGHPG